MALLAINSGVFGFYLQRSADLGFSRHFLWQPAHAAESVSEASIILS
jgi:hypothetical protein